MRIRPYQPGDDQARAHIYNAAAGSLPAFQPATAEDIARRHNIDDTGTGAQFFAEIDEQVVAYAVYSPSGRISYPWCLPGAESARQALLERVLDEMRQRGFSEARAAYRADWLSVLEFLRSTGFEEKRQMINYLAEVAQLPGPRELPDDRVIEPLGCAELSQLVALAPGLFAGMEPQSLAAFFWENPAYDFSQSLFALKDRPGGRVLAGGLFVLNEHFADPSRIDPAMPCFRLGAFGTERERHKRVNGLFSCVFADQFEAELLLSAPAWERARTAGLSYVAAQAPSDAIALSAFYDRIFQRQGAFPILARGLTG